MGISKRIFPLACWGPPNPGPDVFTSGRTRLAAWLFRSLRPLVPAHPGSFLIPYRAIENQKVHPLRSVVLPFFQIAVNVKISKLKAVKIIFKQTNFLCIKMNNTNPKTWARILRQDLIQTVGTQKEAALSTSSVLSLKKSTEPVANPLSCSIIKQAENPPSMLSFPPKETYPAYSSTNFPLTS